MNSEKRKDAMGCDLVAVGRLWSAATCRRFRSADMSAHSKKEMPL
jgi:hypothetical protein